MSGGTQDQITPEERYRNALLWIRTIAGMHYFGDAFDPEHMRALSNLAADALAGKDAPDFEERMAEGKRRAREMADALGFELIGGEETFSATCTGPDCGERFADSETDEYEFATRERMERLLDADGWQADPVLCPACQPEGAGRGH